MDDRASRVALNESRFRDINDRLAADLLAEAEEGEQLEFVCECARLACRDMTQLTMPEYEAVRSDPHHFAIVPGHEVPDLERIVGGCHPRYTLIEKAPPTWAITEATDPRS